MAVVGIFGLNLSPRSGGVYRLMEGLARQGGLSRHRIVYTREAEPGGGEPFDTADNVRIVTGPRWLRQAIQLSVAVPGASRWWGSRRFSAAAMGLIWRLSRADLDAVRGVDVWLWPHCFRPVPNLGGHMVVSHDMIHRALPELFSAGARRCRAASEAMLTDARRVVCPSKASADDLTEAYPALASRVRTFSAAPPQALPTIDEAEVEAVRTDYGGHPILLFVGVDWPHKNHGLLVEVARRMRGAGRSFRVVFAGHRRGGQVGEMVAAAGVGDVVTDEGQVSIDRLAALYAAATALVFPSRREGFGLPLVEAMQAELPIVAARSACVEEVLGGAGELLDGDDAEAWARTLGALLDDPARRHALAARGAERRDHYTWARTWASLDAIFDEVVESG
ncbi:MAG: glycosyltransferase family 1 protein [Planctomycetota bacterium]